MVIIFANQDGMLPLNMHQQVFCKSCRSQLVIGKPYQNGFNKKTGKPVLFVKLAHPVPSTPKRCVVCMESRPAKDRGTITDEVCPSCSNHPDPSCPRSGQEITDRAIVL